MKKGVYVGTITPTLKEMGYTNTPIEVEVMNTVNTESGIQASVVLPNGRLVNVEMTSVILSLTESEEAQIINENI